LFTRWQASRRRLGWKVSKNLAKEGGWKREISGEKKVNPVCLNGNQLTSTFSVDIGERGCLRRISSKCLKKEKGEDSSEKWQKASSRKFA